MYRDMPTDRTTAPNHTQVILADGLVLTFEEIINWDSISIRIPEARASETVDLLRAIPPSQACTMRAKAHHVYSTQLASPEKQVGILLEVLQQRSLPNS